MSMLLVSLRHSGYLTLRIEHDLPWFSQTREKCELAYCQGATRYLPNRLE